MTQTVQQTTPASLKLIPPPAARTIASLSAMPATASALAYGGTARENQSHVALLPVTVCQKMKNVKIKYSTKTAAQSCQKMQMPENVMQILKCLASMVMMNLDVLDPCIVIRCLTSKPAVPLIAQLPAIFGMN